MEESKELNEFELEELTEEELSDIDGGSTYVISKNIFDFWKYL